MAHIEAGGSGGRRKNIDLNLVPFIDLMSVLITFLLITAVWTQVSMIQIGSSIYGKKSESQPNPTPPPLVEVVLRLDVKAQGYTLVVGKETIQMPLLEEGVFDDASLLAQLQRVKQLYPEKQDAIIALTDDLSYEQLIRSMDAVLKAGFPTISVATGAP